MTIKESSYDYQNICPYCYPDKANHRIEKINSFLCWAKKPLILLGQALTLNHPLYATERYLTLCIKLLRKTNNIQMCKDIIRSKTITRLQLIWDEAQKRGLDLYIFQKQGLQLHSYLLRYQEKEYYFHYTPTTLLYRNFKYTNPKVYDHKWHFKKVLQKHNLPVALGKSFFIKNQALRFANSIGYPLVVKPESSTLAHHVTTDINDEQTLSHAFDIAKMIDFKIIVEKYIEGDVHRVICIGDKFIACTKRVKAAIIGDGYSTVEKLIEQFNQHPYRGKLYQTGSAVYQVDKDSPFTLECLCNQNVSLQTIIEKDKIIYLSHKSTCGTGAEVINVTDDVCPENIEIFLKVHHTLKIGVSAVDFIAQDVSKPWDTQNWAFLENNSLPSIDMHHYPSIGNSINVAKEIWDFILRQLEKY